MMAKFLSELKRNDVTSALEFANDVLDRDEWTDDTGQVLMMLQDDPTELIKELNELFAERGLA